MRSCKHCEIKMHEQNFPLAYIRKGRKYWRWECHKCLALLAIERRAKMKEAAYINKIMVRSDGRISRSDPREGR